MFNITCHSRNSINTTLILLLTPERMGIKNTITNDGRTVGKRNVFPLLMGMQIGKTMVDGSMQLPQKLKLESI